MLVGQGHESGSTDIKRGHLTIHAQNSHRHRKAAGPSFRRSLSDADPFTQANRGQMVNLSIGTRWPSLLLDIDGRWLIGFMDNGRLGLPTHNRFIQNDFFGAGR